ncbi:MAG: flagellar protein FlaG [Candidatus Krumholzibacteriia bacterium]
MSDVSAITVTGLPAVSPVAAPGPRHVAREPKAAPSTSPTPPTPEAEQLRTEVESELQRRLSGHEVSLSYKAEAASWVIQIRNPDTGEVVFQIPPEQMVRVRERLQEVLKETGMFVDNST